MAGIGIMGVGFPFRVSSQGAVVTSKADATDFQHLDEGIDQILHTYFSERTMEEDAYSELLSLLFSPNDVSLQSYVSSVVVETLEKNENIILEDDDIEFFDDGGTLYCSITYKSKFSEEEHNVNVKIGEVREEVEE